MTLEQLAHFQSELTFLVKRSPGHNMSDKSDNDFMYISSITKFKT